MKRFALDVVHQAQIADEGLEQALFTALSAVPRRAFISPRFTTRVTENIALPIAFEQTCEAPSVAVRLLSLIGVAPGMRILEVGTGSGYSAALASQLGVKLFSIEKIGLLAQQARKRLDKLGYSNVLVKTGDGFRGWSDAAPFDGIFSSVSVDEHPYELVTQLSSRGGMLVYPRETVSGQRLTLVNKCGNDVKIYSLEKTAFPQAVR